MASILDEVTVKNEPVVCDPIDCLNDLHKRAEPKAIRCKAYNKKFSRLSSRKQHSNNHSAKRTEKSPSDEVKVKDEPVVLEETSSDKQDTPKRRSLRVKREPSEPITPKQVEKPLNKRSSVSALRTTDTNNNETSIGAPTNEDTAETTQIK